MKRNALTCLLLTLCLLFTACGTAQTEQTAAPQTTLLSAESFSDRDYESGYDDTESAFITLSGDTASCSSDAVEVSAGTVTICDEGTYVLSGTLNGMLIVNAEKGDKLQLVLNGVDIKSESSAAIYILQADKVFITLPADTQNTLSNGGVFTAIDDNNIDAVIFSKEDLTLNGTGSLTVDAPAGHGIVSKDDLVITGGCYDITAEKHGIAGKDSVSIAAGEFKITCGKDGIHAENKDDTALGTMLLTGGSFTIAAGDDGLHAANLLEIDGGSILITESYEGIEGLAILITGGEISVVASDDGLNAAGGNDASGFGNGGRDFFADSECSITISGGTIFVNASGDGIDSNGTLCVSGGSTYVSGPTDGGNGALDYNTQAEISGGIFIAAGSSQMAMNFTSATQGAALVNVGKQSAGSAVTLTGANGETLLTFSPEKEYESVLLSCPALLQGESYSLTAGSHTSQLTFDDLLVGSGAMGGMPGGQGGRPGGGMPGGPGGETPAIPDGTGGEMPTIPDGSDSGGEGGRPGGRP